MECSVNECGVCASESIVAFCENCNFRICGTCFQMHKNSTKLFQNHVAFLIETNKPTPDHFISEDDALQFSEHNSGDIHTHKCARHTNEHLVLFCTDHMDTICGRCVVSFHKSCKLIDLSEVRVDDEEVSTCKSNLHDIQEELKSAEDKIEKNTHTNKTCKNEFLTELQKLRTEVNIWFYHQQLKCVKQCNTTFQTNSERLTKVQTFCNGLRQRIQERKELIDKLFTQSHVKRLYVLLNQIRQEIKQIKSKFHWLNSESDFNCYNFKRSSGVDQFLNVSTFDIGGLKEWCSGSDEVSEDLHSEKDAIMEEHENIFADLEKMRSEVKRLQNEKDELSVKNAALEEQAEMYKSHYTNSESNMKQYVRQNMDLQVRLAEQDSLVDLLKDTVQKLTDELDDNKQNLDQLTAINLLEKDRSDDLEMQLKTVKDQMKTVKDRLSAAEQRTCCGHTGYTFYRLS